jgi:arginine decarboxylase
MKIAGVAAGWRSLGRSRHDVQLALTCAGGEPRQDGYLGRMNQDSTPVLDSIARIRQEGTYSFSLPGHRFGRGIDDRMAEVLSRDVFGADVMLAKSAVSDAEELYADAVAVFTTCGSSISIHAVVLTVAGPADKVLVDRNVHKSVVASLILAGVDPVWLRPCWDREREDHRRLTQPSVGLVQALHSDSVLPAAAT